MVPFNTRRLLAGLAIILLGGMTTTACQTPPPPSINDLSFTLQVAFPQNLVASYGGEAAVSSLVGDQMGVINQRFMSLGHFNFHVVSVTYYAGSANDAMMQSHPGANFLLVYSETFGDETGWVGSQQALMVGAMRQQGGVFGSQATDAAVHELGHARGAIDMYAMNVDGNNNPITHQDYQAEQSIMTYPYGETVWDGYSRSIIQASGSMIYQNSPIVSGSLPTTYRVKVVNSYGTPVSGATIQVYPVKWGSNAVASQPVMSGSTTSGVWQLPANPFAGKIGDPYDTSAGNFLVTATRSGQTASTWMPISEAGKAFFAFGAAAPYELTLTLG